MTESGNEEINERAFAYLTDVRRKFIQNYDYEKIAGFYAYQLTEFAEILKQLMVKCKSFKNYLKFLL
jgi:hypothetical protein